jgi:hypothetical protein
MSEELKPDIRAVGRQPQPFCFSNGAFGERIADLSWDLTGKNFTETLMRRSYITSYWKTHSALKEYNWTGLLQSVHQTSKSANLGYLKDYDEALEAWIKLTKPTVPASQWPAVLQAEQQRREQEILLKEGHLGDPEMDPAALNEAEVVKEGFQVAKKQQRIALEAQGKTSKAGQKEIVDQLEAAKQAKPDTGEPEVEAEVQDVGAQPKAKKGKKKAQSKQPEPQAKEPEPQAKEPEPKVEPKPKAKKPNAKAVFLEKPKIQQAPPPREDELGVRRSGRERKPVIRD